MGSGSESLLDLGLVRGYKKESDRKNEREELVVMRDYHGHGESHRNAPGKQDKPLPAVFPWPRLLTSNYTRCNYTQYAGTQIKRS